MHKIPVIISNSRIKTIWNIIIVFAVLAFSIVFSYRFTFQIYRCDLFYWVILSLFALDILVNFNSTVKVEHSVSGDRRVIAKNYLKGWFTVDFITAFPFDFFILLIFGVPDEHDGRHFYFIILQLITLVKLLKVKKITKELQQYLRINPGVMRLMDFAFWFTQAVHYIALGWIVIGAAETARISIDQYIRSLYWSVTTVATIGYGDYYPDHDSNLQIIYTIIVQIFGVGMYGYIIGNVSGLIANLDVARAEFVKKIESVRIYLNNKSIPKDMQEKILSYYYYIWDKKRNVSEDNPLSDLPVSISLEIMLYLNRDMLMKVDLFRHADDIFVREAIQMLKPLIYLPEDYIIRQGEYGDCMFFLSSGEIEVLVNGKQAAKLGPGSTFGETSLLIGEKRSASIHTLTYCEVYRLSKSDFDSLRIRFPEFNAEMEEISRQRKLLNE
jgi:voltage-gated potassium channel